MGPGPANKTSLFIGNIDSNLEVEILEKDLFELCSQCGVVLSMRLPAEGARSRGFAFVEMGSRSAALYATLALNGIHFYGRYLRVACAMDEEKELSLRLENVDAKLDEAELYNLISAQVAGICGISVRRNHSGRSDYKCTIWLQSVEELGKARVVIRGLFPEVEISS